ncbi:IS630 family transposase, partial [Halomonas sp. QX-1]|nr:IS630 family transposase [Halomonas maris]NVF14707.1 IS630 family transposase [Halomonas maris]
YTWLPLSAYLSFERLHEEVHRLLGGYGTDHAINFE